MFVLEGLGMVESASSLLSMAGGEEQGSSLPVLRSDINEKQLGSVPDVPPESTPDSNFNHTTNDCHDSLSVSAANSPNDSFTTSTSLLYLQPTTPEASPSRVATTRTIQTTLNVNAKPFVWKQKTTDLTSGSTEPLLASDVPALSTPYLPSTTTIEHPVISLPRLSWDITGKHSSPVPNAPPTNDYLRQPTIPERAPSTLATTRTIQTTLNVNAKPFVWKQKSTNLASGSTEPLFASNVPAVSTPHLHSSMTTVETPSSSKIVFTATTTSLKHRATTTSSKVKTKKAPLKFRGNSPDKHYALVTEAAQAAVTVLHKIGLKCALFGSTAAKLYGATRIPEDVDILTFPGDGNLVKDAMQIKADMVKLDSRFFLKLPKDRTKPYRVLWFQSVVPPRTKKAERQKKQCKVDILVPGIMNLPNLRDSEDCLRWLSTIPPGATRQITLPVLPFPILLLHKLQGWTDHRVAPESFKRIKQTQDVEDIKQLLSLRNEIDYLVSLKHYTSQSHNFPDICIPTLLAIWTNPIWFPTEFQEDSRKRIRLFCYYHPECKWQWAQLGFMVEPVKEEIIDEMAEVLKVEGVS